MARVKEYYTQVAQKEVDEIIEQFDNNQLSVDEATKKLEKVENIDTLLHIDKNDIYDFLVERQHDY